LGNKDSKVTATRSAMIAGAVGILMAGCRTPTQVTVEIATDVPCDEMPDTTVQVGRIGADLETRPVSIATRTCGAQGRIGSFVVAPSGEPSDEFAIKLILGHGGRTALGCRSDESSSEALPGCIFARRGLHFVPHTELTLPVVLRGDCDGIVCRDPATTCVHGSCVRAVIPNPGTCRGAGCDDTVLGTADAGGNDSEGGASDGGSSGDDARDGDLGSLDGPTADAPLGRGCDGGACTPPSCATPLVCGAASDSCCESPLVTGDTFLRQNSQAYPAKVSSFRLDKYEVTVGRFRAFVQAMTSSSWLPPEGSGKHRHLPAGGLYSVNQLELEQGWDPAWNVNLPQATTVWNDALDCQGASWTPSPGANEYRPIVCVSWYDAYAFCIWDGGFLPTYAEWNYAAEGGREQRAYPWGNTPPDLNHAQYCPGFPSCATLITVGFKVPGNGHYGQSDLAGNAWEYVLDTSPAVTGDVCNDCVLFDAGSDMRTVLGGGYDGSAATLAADFVSADTMNHRDQSDGFRCARPP
jgi:formylglycine-generating enzyme required for sulfatase activity